MKKLFVLVVAFSLLFVSPAYAYVIGDSWGMVPNSNNKINEISGSDRDITVYGDWETTSNGNGLVWTKNTGDIGYGVAENSSDDDPETRIVAIGARITVSQVLTGSSGNIIQKGFFNDDGQIKLQVVPANGGTYECRFEGSLGEKFVRSTITDVADGTTDEVYCSRNGSTLSISVNGTVTPATFNVGTIITGRDVYVGNRLGGDTSDQHYGRNLCSAYSHGSGSINFVESTIGANC
jgi:hypothetical protein